MDYRATKHTDRATSVIEINSTRYLPLSEADKQSYVLCAVKQF